VKDPAQMVSEIRAIFATFDWEFHDRQLALEAIERIITDDDPAADGWSFLVGPIRSLADTLGAVRLTTSVTNAPEPVRIAVRKLADEITVWQRGIGPQHRPDSVTKL
jgi:hypothetical protein